MPKKTNDQNHVRSENTKLKCHACASPSKKILSVAAGFTHVKIQKNTGLQEQSIKSLIKSLSRVCFLWKRVFMTFLFKLNS